MLVPRLVPAPCKELSPSLPVHGSVLRTCSWMHEGKESVRWHITDLQKEEALKSSAIELGWKPLSGCLTMGLFSWRQCRDQPELKGSSFVGLFSFFALGFHR